MWRRMLSRDSLWQPSMERLYMGGLVVIRKELWGAEGGEIFLKEWMDSCLVSDSTSTMVRGSAFGLTPGVTGKH